MTSGYFIRSVRFAKVQAALVPDAAGRAGAAELISDYEQEHGQLPAESRRRAREFMLESGLLDEAPERAAS